MDVPFTQRHDRHLRQPADLRVLPGLRQPRLRHAAHRQPQGRQRAPPVRDGVQGLRARAARGAGARSALGRRHSVDQGLASDCDSDNTVAVVDYGMGNLRSVSQAVQHARRPGRRARCSSPRDPEVVRRPTRVVLPGQGAMPDCMRELRDSGLLELGAARPRPASRCSASASACRCCCRTATKGRPTASGLIPARCVQFELEGRAAARRQPLQGAADGLEPGLPGAAAPGLGGRARPELFLFRPQLLCAARRSRATASARPTTARRFTAAVARDNIFATQFHPEKSADHGLRSTEISSTGTPDADASTSAACRACRF